VVISALYGVPTQIPAPHDPPFADHLCATTHKPDSRSSATETQESPFHCDGRTYCSQMTSWLRGEVLSRALPDVKMDGDHDGIPARGSGVQWLAAI